MTSIPWIRLQATEAKNLDAVLFLEHMPTSPVSFPYAVSSSNSSVKVSKLSSEGYLRMAPRKGISSEVALFTTLVKEQCNEIGLEEKPADYVLAHSRPVKGAESVIAPWVPSDMGIWFPKGEYNSPDYQASIGACTAVKAFANVRYAGFLAHPEQIKWVRM